MCFFFSALPLDLADLREKLKELSRSVEGKSAKEETQRLAEVAQQHERILKELHRAIDELRSSSGKGPTITGDLVVQINNKIDKLEFKLEGLDNEMKELLKQ